MSKTLPPAEASPETARSELPRVFPVALRVEGRRCLVVGGGTEAARKAAGLAGCGALVTVIAPHVGPEMTELVAGRRSPCTAEVSSVSFQPGVPRGAVTLVTRRYEPGDAGHFRLVITATGTPAVDGSVADDAERRGVWVNSADDPDHCSFFLPSVHRDDPVTIAVSTAGYSPALSAWLRRRIAAELGPGLGTLACILDEGRDRLRSAGRAGGDVGWASVLDAGLFQRVRSGDIGGARRIVSELVELALGGGGDATPSGTGHHQHDRRQQ
jgi:siroheme synthase-like protein